MKFSIEHEFVSGNILKVKLKGDLFGELNENVLISFVQQKVNEGHYNFIFDLSELRFIDSSGIGLLITCLTKFRNKGGELILLNPSAKLKDLLAMTKLEAIFKIENDLESSLAKFE